MNGQYALPSGVLVSTVPAKEAKALLEKERELFREAYAARQHKMKKQQDFEKLQEKTEKDRSKLKEMEKQVQNMSKTVSEVGESFAQLAEGARQAINMRKGM